MLRKLRTSEILFVGLLQLLRKLAGAEAEADSSRLCTLRTLISAPRG